MQQIILKLDIKFVIAAINKANFQLNIKSKKRRPRGRRFLRTLINIFYFFYNC